MKKNTARAILILAYLSVALLLQQIASSVSVGQDVQPGDAQPVVLDLLLTDTPKPNYGTPVPKVISGRVLLHTPAGISGAEGVSVTDGYSVTKTNSKGVYLLKPNSHAVFVYITRPTGHDVRGHWYKPLAANVDFNVEPAEAKEDEYIFIHVTDTHVSQNPRSLAGLSRFVREVNDLTPQPRFVVNSGDLLNLSKALVNSPEAGQADFRQYVGIMNHLTMPHYSVSGDHTDSSYRLKQFPRGDHRCGKPLYWEHLGPHFFSFEYGQIHFVSVDFGYHLGRKQIAVNGKDLEYPTNQVQPMHAEWLQQDMRERAPGTFVVTTSEADLEDHCPDFAKMAEQHDIRFQLVGDIHVVSHKTRSVPYRTGGALAGCWWNPKAQQLCPDLSPQGYLVYRAVGDKLEHFYKGLGQRVAIVSHRVGAPLQGRVVLKAHLVQPQQDESLEYSLNGTDWLPMIEIDRPFYRTVYQAVVDSTSLPDGLHSFQVRSTGGEVRTREFVVANQRDESPDKKSPDKKSLDNGEQVSLAFTVGTDNGWTTHKAPSGKVDVHFNGTVIGTLMPDTVKEYSFPIPETSLRKANLLSFRFADPNDGMSLGSPVLTVKDMPIRDPRDSAIRQVRIAHWSETAVDWGGFIVGNAAPPDETPFHRKQNVFCFVIEKKSR